VKLPIALLEYLVYNAGKYIQSKYKYGIVVIKWEKVHRRNDNAY